MDGLVLKPHHFLACVSKTLQVAWLGTRLSLAFLTKFIEILISPNRIQEQLVRGNEGWICQSCHVPVLHPGNAGGGEDKPQVSFARSRSTTMAN